MIEIYNVTKKISDSFTLQINNITLQNKTNYKVYGINGSGKTLFLKTILEIISKDKGHIKKDNATISGFLGIHRMIDFLTPKEYFYIVCKSYGICKKDVINRYNYINSFFNRKYLHEKKLICDYSDGNKQLIGIMASCLPFSSFVLLDEPFNYLDELTAAQLLTMINKLNQDKNISFIYSDNANRLKLDHYKTIFVQDGNVSML